MKQNVTTLEQKIGIYYSVIGIFQNFLTMIAK